MPAAPEVPSPPSGLQQYRHVVAVVAFPPPPLRIVLLSHHLDLEVSRRKLQGERL